MRSSARLHDLVRLPYDTESIHAARSGIEVEKVCYPLIQNAGCIQILRLSMSIYGFHLVLKTASTFLCHKADGQKLGTGEMSPALLEQSRRFFTS